MGLLQRVDPFISPMYRLCSIRMQGILYRPQYHVFLGKEIKPRFLHLILLHEKFLQFDWLRALVFQLNLKCLHVKITSLLWVVV